MQPWIMAVRHATACTIMEPGTEFRYKMIFRISYFLLHENTASHLTLKAPITTAVDDNFFILFFFYYSEKASLEISCELSAWQMIHMKCQDLFSLKIKKNLLNVICYKFYWAL